MVMARKFHAFVEYPGDVVNKAWLYDKSTSQPGTSLGPKIIRYMVDYSTKIEKLLREMRILLQLVGTQPEPAPATQQPTPARAPTPITQPEEVTLPTGRPDPTLQEAISKINTEDIASLEQWVVGGLQNMATSTTGSRGTTILGSQSTLGSNRLKAQKKADKRNKRRAEEMISKSRSSSKDEEDKDPVTLSSDKEEYAESETSSQSDLVDDPKPRPSKFADL